jgi:hypothetical protein
VRADVSFGHLSVVVAFLLTVAGPAAGGIALLRSSSARALSPGRRDALRRQVLESEILRIAATRGNRMTVIELVTELSLTAEEAKAVLDDMMARSLADIEITDGGGIVYTFPDLEQLGERDRTRKLLE